MGTEHVRRVDHVRRSGASPLPDELRTNLESLSGVDLSGVDVHYRSARPAEVGALAFAQGTSIHVAPGQERHLPHEAWHVVQQARGRVAPMERLNRDQHLNTESRLEREAEVMGHRAARIQRSAMAVAPDRPLRPPATPRIVQLMATAKGKSVSNLKELNVLLKSVGSSVVIGPSDFEDDSPTASALDTAIAAASTVVTKSTTRRQLIADIGARLSNQKAQAKKPPPDRETLRRQAAKACRTFDGQYYGGDNQTLHVHDVGGDFHLKGPGGSRKNIYVDSKLRVDVLRDARTLLEGHPMAATLHAAIDKALIAYNLPLDNY